MSFLRSLRQQSSRAEIVLGMLSTKLCSFSFPFTKLHRLLLQGGFSGAHCGLFAKGGRQLGMGPASCLHLPAHSAACDPLGPSPFSKHSPLLASASPPQLVHITCMSPTPLSAIWPPFLNPPPFLIPVMKGPRT